MKVGVNLVGISKGSRDRDWERTKNNIKENVIDCWGEDTKVYITTYHHDTIDTLMEFYNPSKRIILDINAPDSHQQLTYIQSLKLMRNEDIDIVVSTRFDIEFKRKLSSYTTIDYEKFNFLFKEGRWWSSNEFVTDNLFIFPKRYIDSAVNAIMYMYMNPERKYNGIATTDLHPMYKVIRSMIGIDNTHFITNDEAPSNTNNHYNLMRDE